MVEIPMKDSVATWLGLKRESRERTQQKRRNAAIRQDAIEKRLPEEGGSRITLTIKAITSGAITEPDAREASLRGG